MSKNTSFIDVGYGFTGKWRICDLPVCPVCGLPVTRLWNTNGMLLPDGVTEDGRRKWESIRGTDMSTVHARCYKSVPFAPHDWREEMQWVNAPKGWWNPVPIEDCTSDRIIKEMRSRAYQEIKLEEDEELGLGGQDGIISGDATFGDDSGVSFFEMLGTERGVNAAFDQAGQWSPPLEKDKDGNYTDKPIERYSHMWGALVWQYRRMGMTYLQIHKVLTERFSSQNIPHEDTIYNWLEGWYKGGDPMEVRIREEGIKYTLSWYEKKQMNARDAKRFANMCDRFMKLYKELMNLKEPEKDKRFVKLQHIYTKYIAKEDETDPYLLVNAMEKHGVKKLGRLWCKLSGQAYIPDYLREHATVPGVPLQVCVYFDLVDDRTVARLEGRSTQIVQGKLDAQWRHIKHVKSGDLMNYAAMYRKFKKGRII